MDEVLTLLKSDIAALLEVKRKDPEQLDLQSDLMFAIRYFNLTEAYQNLVQHIEERRAGIKVETN